MPPSTHWPYLILDSNRPEFLRVRYRRQLPLRHPPPLCLVTQLQQTTEHVPSDNKPIPTALPCVLVCNVRGRNDCKKALCAATKYMVGVVVIVALVSGILFALLGQSDVPVRDFEVREGGSSVRKRLTGCCCWLGTFRGSCGWFSPGVKGLVVEELLR